MLAEESLSFGSSKDIESIFSLVYMAESIKHLRYSADKDIGPEAWL
jgi:hypothetical protein